MQKEFDCKLINIKSVGLQTISHTNICYQCKQVNQEDISLSWFANQS